MKQLTFYVVLSSVFLLNGVVLADNASKSPIKVTIEKRTTTSTIPSADSDNIITSRVREKLRNDPAFSENRVTIITKDHVVTLKGFVLSDDAKKALAEKAKSVEGVTSVDNNLEVQKPAK